MILSSVAFVLILTASFFLILNGLNKEKGSGIYARINDIEVTDKELDIYVDQYRSIVSADFSTRYNIDSFGESFWTTDFDGKTPEQELKEVAFHALSRDKIIQQIAVSYKITAPLNFQEFEKAWLEQNYGKSDEINYGPTNVQMYEYLQYLMTQVKDDLKTYLSENVWEPSEDELRAAFNSLDEEIRMTNFIASGYEFDWTDENSPSEDIKNAINNGMEPFDAFASLFATFPTLSCKAFELNTSEIHREDLPSYDKANHLTYAKEKSFVELHEIKKLYYVVDFEGGWLEYEDAPAFGYTKWINDSFDQLVDSTLEKATIKKYR